MDTSGKDGTIRAVFKETGPMGVAVTAFSRPSADELAHDFTCACTKPARAAARSASSNRSHYEDVLVGRVRGLAAPHVIEHRYNQINAFEDLIASSTKIVKLMLHISRDEQRARLQSRLDTPHKRWKFDPSDLDDRLRWDDYMAAYETVLERCSTEAAPWYLIPSDRKWARNAAVAAVVRRTLEEMDPRYPAVAWDPDQFRVD